MYENFADVYDRLTDDVGYEKRTEYLLSLFERFDRRPTLLLDLACGTGGFSNELSHRGISVIGVDISEEMLAVASENSRNAGQNVLYLCQDAAELDLFGTVDGAVCCLDSLNHITDYGRFCKAVARVSLFLEPDRLFIFDLNTPYKHKEILGSNTFVIDDDDVYCVWQNEYRSADGTVDMALDIFKRNGNAYFRSGEFITERAYTADEVRRAIASAGLELIAEYGDMGFEAPEKNEEHIIYITRKAG